MKSYPLYIIVSFALLALGSFFLIWPKYQEFGMLEQEILEKKSELESQDEYFKDLELLSVELEKRQEFLLKIDAAITEKRSLPELLNFLQKTASQSRTVIRALAPSFIGLDLEKGVNVTRLNIQLDGSYVGLKEFISNIEKSARLIEVNNITFSYPEDEELFSFNINMTIYSY